MQYRISLPDDSSTGSCRFAALVEDADPSAVTGLTPTAHSLRLSTCLRHTELHALATLAGLLIEANAIELLPSDCCGGCGG